MSKHGSNIERLGVEAAERGFVATVRYARGTWQVYADYFRGERRYEAADKDLDVACNAVRLLLFGQDKKP